MLREWPEQRLRWLVFSDARPDAGLADGNGRHISACPSPRAEARSGAPTPSVSVLVSFSRVRVRPPPVWVLARPQVRTSLLPRVRDRDPLESVLGASTRVVVAVGRGPWGSMRVWGMLCGTGCRLRCGRRWTGSFRAGGTCRPLPWCVSAPVRGRFAGWPAACESDHRHLGHGLGAVGMCFVVAGEAAVVHEPDGGPLEAQRRRNHLEALVGRAAAGDLGVDDLGVGAGVGPGVGDAGGRRRCSTVRGCRGVVGDASSGDRHLQTAHDRAAAPHPATLARPSGQMKGCGRPLRKGAWAPRRSGERGQVPASPAGRVGAVGDELGSGGGASG